MRGDGESVVSVEYVDACSQAAFCLHSFCDPPHMEPHVLPAHCAGLLLFLLLSINTLAGVQAKVGQFLKDVVGTEHDPLMIPQGDLARGGSGIPPPYIPFKGGSHVE